MPPLRFVAVPKSAPAPILTHREFAKLRDEKGHEMGRIVATSGGFDPIHMGHVSCILESREYGDTLVVIVNGDDFLVHKKGRAFQSSDVRCMIASAIRGVDYVVLFDIQDDATVAEALRCVRPHVFTKGGDRVKGKSLPAAEEAVCAEFDIELVDGVGLPKYWSSSDALSDWVAFKSETDRS
jgi:cytidyltransferase-like protein